MINDLSGKGKSALLGAAKIALGLMGEGIEAPRVPRPEVDISSLVDKYPPGVTLPELPAARRENAWGKALCGTCQHKLEGRWRCNLDRKCPPYSSLPCPVPVPSAGCPSRLPKPSVPRSTQPKKKGLPVPPGVKFLYVGRVVRHQLRENKPWIHQGIVTVAWIESSPGTIVMGFSFCSPEDRWCKATGRDMALTRISVRPLVIPFLYSPKRTVHEVARTVLAHDFGRLAALSPGVTMWGRVPSWTRGLGKRMEEKERMVVRRLMVPSRLPDFFLGGIYIAPPTRGLPFNIMSRMMADIAKLEDQ